MGSLYYMTEHRFTLNCLWNDNYTDIGIGKKFKKLSTKLFKLYYFLLV